MKKIGVKILTMFLTFAVMTGTVYADGDKLVTPSDEKKAIYTVAGDEEMIPELLSKSAIVIDLKTGYSLVEKYIYDKLYPASITKIMTAMLTIEHAKPEDIVTFSQKAVFSVEPGSSAAYVDVDEQLTVEQCLYGLMLISGNDLANGLAEHVGGSMENFATMMTDKAEEIGCLNTNFTNAHGLHDESHYTTAHDMAIIAKYAYDNYETFRTLCSTGYYECPPTNKQSEVRKWRNNNRLINKYEEQYNEACIGGKTGYTNQAGGTLVTYAKINGREILCVVMKSANSLSAYADTTNLYNYIKEYISDDMYEALDKKYEESQKVIEESVTTETVEKVSTVAPVVDDADEEDSLWIGWKILILAVTVFIIYYVYIQYMRYQKRKKRREMRMRRKP